MHLDPVMPDLVGATFAILIVAMLLKIARQPYVVGYIVAGLIIGPAGLRILDDRPTIDRLGAFGIVFLLFFIGMEVSPRQLVKNWRIPLVGTLLQVAGSVGVVAVLGGQLGWPVARIVLLGFVISLSSTAVVLKVLEERGELGTKLGLDVVGVLLVQDVLLVPMLIVVGVVGGQAVPAHTLWLQTAGGALVIGVVVALAVGPAWRLPLAERLRADRELQVFAALALCLGFATVTGLFEISAALGAFVAGMIVGTTRETDWVHHSLHSFRVVFVSLFFVSVGMLVDPAFVREHAGLLAVMILAALGTNTFLNMLVFRALGESWRTSLYSGAILSQIGELSFIVAALGLHAGIVDEFAYQVTVATICGTLVVSPIWIAAVRAVLGPDPYPESLPPPAPT